MRGKDAQYVIDTEMYSTAIFTQYINRIVSGEVWGHLRDVRNVHITVRMYVSSLTSVSTLLKVERERR